MVIRTGLVAAALVAAMSSGAFAADPVVQWNANAGFAATQACIAPELDPFHESRMYAMMHIAIHDALNAINRRYLPHTLDVTAEAGTSSDAAVAAAARGVLIPVINQLPTAIFKQSCLDAGVTSVEAAYVEALKGIPDSAAKTQGVNLGQAAAAAIIKARADDHGTDGPFINQNCPKPAGPGVYQCTPERPFVAFERWAFVTPFVLQNNEQFRPGPPFDVTGADFKKDLAEVTKLGGNGTTTPSARTEDQTQIAYFWLESSPLKWSRIARTVATDKNLSPWESARLFAIINMALADGYIAMSASKNHYEFWRPVTAIRATGDANWTPLAITPPNQDYPSGHSIEGGVGAEVLAQFFGTDKVSFQDCGALLPGGNCYDPTPIRRSYTSFTQAAQENAYSRILVGFHFRNATDMGTEYGRQIGERAATMLQPVK